MSRTEPNYATCCEVSRICKRTSNICGVLSPRNLGAKSAYLELLFSSTKTCKMPKTGTGNFYPLSANDDYDYGTSHPHNDFRGWPLLWRATSSLRVWSSNSEDKPLG